MKCKNCGAELLDTDTFCVNCGQKVEQTIYCANCGEKLREGEKFCHKCGAKVAEDAEDDEIPVVKQNTVDIPFDMIEQGILLQTEQAIVKRPQTAREERQSYSGSSAAREERESYGRASAVREEREGYSRPSAVREEREDYRRPVAAREERESYGRASAAREERESYSRTSAVRGDAKKQQRKAPASRYEDYRDYEEEDSGDSKFKIITIIMGIVVIAVAIVVAYVLWTRNSPSRYERPENEAQQEETAGDETSEEGEGSTGNNTEVQGRLQILSNVNVRNKPSTDDSEVLMVAKKGETYLYYELIDDAWYHIQLDDDREGYVFKEYVEDLE